MARAGGDVQPPAVELQALDPRTLSGVVGARPEAGQQRGWLERLRPDLDPGAKAVTREGEVRVVARADEDPTPALEQAVDHVRGARVVCPRDDLGRIAGRGRVEVEG